MPELPEVEHVVRALRRAIIGRQIVGSEIKLRKLIWPASPASFGGRVRHAWITGVSRRGKFILIELHNQLVLLVHLRMTGKFLCLATDDALPKHAHAIFYFDNEKRLVFCDQRQFGVMKVFTLSRLNRAKELAQLAPEPFSDQFSAAYLRNTLSRSRRTLKQVLLDQTKIVGLGNIYASEALFLARISPMKSAQSLSRQRATRLHEAIRAILQEAIDAGSTLRIDLTEANGSYFGTTERFWRVYEREGEPCVNCGRKIRRIVQGGRSTYYCPRCQRK